MGIPFIDQYLPLLCRIVFLERPVVYSTLVKEVMALFPVHPTLTYQDDKVLMHACFAVTHSPGLTQTNARIVVQSQSDLGKVCALHNQSGKHSCKLSVTETEVPVPT